jgi:hypothetical protein
MSRTTRVVAVLECAVLGGYFLSVHTADSFLPERGGSGDATSIYLWNGRAVAAFWFLVVLWLVALALVAYHVLRRERSAFSLLQAVPRGADAVAVGLPLVGLFIGYVALLVLQ